VIVIPSLGLVILDFVAGYLVTMLMCCYQITFSNTALSYVTLLHNEQNVWFEKGSNLTNR